MSLLDVNDLILTLKFPPPSTIHKVSRGVLFSPALYPASVPLGVFTKIFGKFLFDYIGPFPPKSIFEFVEGFTCASEFAADTICEFIFNTMFGTSGHQQTMVSTHYIIR